jgi:hypothetical protein
LPNDNLELFIKWVDALPQRFKIPAMRQAVLWAALIGLGGCSPDRDKTLIDCQKDADRFFQGSQADDPENPRSQYIIGCMAANDYDFNVEPKHCDSRFPFSTQAACYTSKNWIDRIMDQFHQH